ncbi:MAG TPA: MYXO-CTERM sorting domain-containing protein, partial [Kofleriaceae bacterium]
EVEGWVKANKSVALNPPLRSAAEAAADNDNKSKATKDAKSGGCSTSDASLGVLFVGATLFVVFRRRRRTAA